nr:MAG TPA: hypothetical protein [Caudoviricetes sp.]
MEISKNKLWALPTTEKNLKLQEKFSHFYSDADHILIISSEMPDGATEVSPDLEWLLTQADWLWIWNESAAIQREEEQKYRKELDNYMKGFEERFLAELDKMQKGGADIGNNAAGADGSSGNDEL